MLIFPLNSKSGQFEGILLGFVSSNYAGPTRESQKTASYLQGPDGRLFHLVDNPIFNYQGLAVSETKRRPSGEEDPHYVLQTFHSQQNSIKTAWLLCPV